MFKFVFCDSFCVLSYRFFLWVSFVLTSYEFKHVLFDLFLVLFSLLLLWLIWQFMDLLLFLVFTVLVSGVDGLECKWWWKWVLRLFWFSCGWIFGFKMVQVCSLMNFKCFWSQVKEILRNFLVFAWKIAIAVEKVISGDQRYGGALLEEFYCR